MNSAPWTEAAAGKRSGNSTPAKRRTTLNAAAKKLNLARSELARLDESEKPKGQLRAV
jgi:hypothetical protein